MCLRSVNRKGLDGSMTAAGPEHLSFSVDTHLLRELGALLVGRESTALLELIKNSYDADAFKVTVHGENLDGPLGRITVSDDGNGMTYARFREAFLRIAGRDKEGERLSRRYRRRYTGAKGIGRLSAHKLASSLIVESVPKNDTVGQDPDDRVGVDARLDWDRMEAERSDISALGDTLVARRVEVAENVSRGTVLTLTGLRGNWPNSRLGPFLEEIRRCRPPDVLVESLPEDVLPETLLFAEPLVREHGPNDPGFKLDLTGDFEGGDELWLTMAHRADWLIEISGSASGVEYGIAPTVRTKEKLSKRAHPSWVRSYRFAGPHPDPQRGPFFHARFMVTEGTLGPARSRAPLANFSRHESGIRIFLEGFRVLPYGSAGDDWLLLDRDYVKKRREYQVDVDDSELPQLADEAFFQLGNRAYYGAVFLTERRAPHLQALVNREGFLPDSYFENLRSMVRTGIDLCVRARAALDRRITAAEKDATADRIANTEREAGQETESQTQGSPTPAHPYSEARRSSTDAGDHGTVPAASTAAARPPQPQTAAGSVATSSPKGLAGVQAVLGEAIEAVTAARLSPGGSESGVEGVSRALDLVLNEVENARDEQSALRTLAGMGTQYAAFVHEVNGLLAQAQSMRRLIERLIESGPYTQDQLRGLRQLLVTSDDLVQSLTRQASYLTDVVGPDARRRRRRLGVRDRVESTLRLLQGRLAQRAQSVNVNIDPNVKSPPIFPAELAIVLTNLLTNSVKFSGHGGKIDVRAWLDPKSALHILVQNTGATVTAEDRERFFRPFESTTVDVDAVLGQGMGLGLPIVRSLLVDYNGRADFVDPDNGFHTAVEIVLPDPRPPSSR